MSARLNQEGFNVRDFGAKGDNIADDSPAFQAMINASIGSGFARGRKCFVPRGEYKLNSTVYLRRAVHLVGETGGSPFSSVQLFPANNITALQVDYRNLIDFPEERGAGSIIENFLIGYGATPTVWQPSTAYVAGQRVVSIPGYGDFAGNPTNPNVSDLYTMECLIGGTSGGTSPNWDATVPLTNPQGSLTLAEGATLVDGTVTWVIRVLAGIRMHASAKVHNVWIQNAPGNGILVAASVGWNPYSNANNFEIDKVVAIQCAMHGLFVQGSDANAGVVTNYASIENARWGIYDHSFLGNTYNACNASTNGGYRGVTSISRTGTTVTVNTATTHDLLPGNLAIFWSSPDVNFPTGQITVLAAPTPTQFTFTQAGVSGPGVGTFLFKVGGGPYKAYDFNARNTFVGCYAEGDQLPEEIASPSIVIGGIHAANFSDGGSSATAFIDGHFKTPSGTIFQNPNFSSNPKRTFLTAGFVDYPIHISSASEGAVFAITSLTRVSGLVTVVTATPHGYQNGQSRFITANNDPNFAGGLKTVLEVIGLTTFTYLEAGADAVGIAGHFALGDGGGTGFTVGDNGPTGFEGWWCWRHANLDARMFMAWSGNLSNIGAGGIWFPQGVRLGGQGAYQSLLEFSGGAPAGWVVPYQHQGSLRLNANLFPQAGYLHGIFGWQFINDGVGDGVQILRHPHFGFNNQIDVTNGVGSPFLIDWKKHAGVAFTNEGAPAKAYFTLQDSTGIPDLRCSEFSFFVKDSDGIRIVCPAGRKIRWGVNVTAAGGYVESTTVGSWLKLKLVGTLGDPEYIVTESSGSWTDGVFVISEGNTGVTNLIANYIVTAADDGTLFTNIGATGPITITLPASAPAFTVRFACVAAFPMIVQAVGADVIYNGTAVSTAAGTISSNTVTSTIELAGVSGAKWLSFGPTGSWATA